VKRRRRAARPRPAADGGAAPRAGALWGGRFASGPGPELRALGDSLCFDARLLPQDIEGSLAHAAMLGATGILPAADARRLRRGLRSMAADAASGRLSVAGAADEDVHSFVERVLTERVGPAGRKLHAARSRNDQVATDLRLWLRAEAAGARADLRRLASALAAAAGRADRILVPAYTHLQRGQPVLLAHHILAHAEPLLRDDARVADAVGRSDASCPLGSGACTGTGFPVDRRATARALGFAAPSANSMDSVADRDFAVEYLAAAALGMAHLSRLAEDCILWTSSEFGFARLSDAVSTGSSLMPQKRNPDPAELVRGKAGRVFGSLLGLLVVLKGLPLAYNRDLQEDKEALFDGADTWRACLRAAAALVDGLAFDAAACARALEGGYLDATEAADYLVERGVPFRDAHEAAGRAVREAEARGVPLQGLPDAAWRKAHPRFGPDLRARLDPRRIVARRDHEGGTAPRRVAAATARLRRWARSRAK
jgi:argininosuccinate lyase